MTSHVEHDARTPPPPLPIALELCAALQGAGVGFVHWKSNDHLAEALAGETDIDMYVVPADRGSFERVMAGNGGLKIISQPWGTYPGIEDWLVLDPSTGRFLHIHLHYALMTGLKRVKHLMLPWAAVLMANLRKDPSTGWPIPTAEMELLILLVRIWAKMPPWRRWFKSRIPSHIKRELDWLRNAATEGELRRLLKALVPAADEAKVLRVLRTPAPSTAETTAIARLLNDQLRDQFRMSWGAALVLAAVRNSRMALAKAFRMIVPEIRTGKTVPGGGMMIAFVGSDGAGKSTLGRDIHKWLRFKLDVHGYYMGSGDGGTHLLDWLRRGIRAAVRMVKGAAKKTKHRPAEPKADRQNGFVMKVVELYQLLLMRHKVKLLRAGRKLADGGSMVLTDRYPQTQFTGISDGPKIQDGRSFAWAARRELKHYDRAMALGPDLVIKLVISPDVAHARKPDHDFAAIARKCEVVNALEFHQCPVRPIDASRPYEDVLLATKTAIWSQLTGKPA